MLWAIYFIRFRIVEIGRLQYEYLDNINGKCFIKIHIPSDGKLNNEEVLESIEKSRIELKRNFNIRNISYVCESWLLSNKLNKMLNPNSNIYKFYTLFDVKDGKNCVDDILNFVYSLRICSDYNLLEESTSLQKLIKKELIAGGNFYSGIGILKDK